MGVVDQFKEENHKINKFDCVFGGNIPIVAGLSSSAAIESGLVFALNYIYNLSVDRKTLVRISQKAKNEFVGIKCGIMGQYINIFGKIKNVPRIYCRTLDYKYFPFNFKNVSIVLFDTNVSHSLASTEYNKRRNECGTGVEIIRKVL